MPKVSFLNTSPTPSACLPTEDYPLFRALMLEKFIGWKNIRDWGNKNAAILDEILNHIYNNGAVRSSDFENKQSRGKWWDWKVEKVALEHLYYRGDLMIARRESFQRVYDLRERVLPAWNDTQAPVYPAAVLELTRKAIKHWALPAPLGAANYFYLKRSETAASRRAALAEGAIYPARIEGCQRRAMLCPCRKTSPSFKATLAGPTAGNPHKHPFPFRTIGSDRGRAEICLISIIRSSVYTPASKRKYGSFVLPILHHGRLIGSWMPKPGAKREPYR